MKNSLLVLISLLFVSATFGQESTPISAVQGDGYYSPLADKKVKVEGVVTAIRRRGFYIQTPDEKVDENPKTSEGIYVFTLDSPDSEITVGKLVEVEGKVAEFKPKREVYALFLTEIIEPKIKVISEDNPLPEPILLSRENLKPKGQIDQLERFEGMRVKIEELTVVAPTGGFFDKSEDKIKSDGVFFGVLAGTPRPFRETGLDALKVLIDKLPRTLPVFDMNPELIRVDGDGLNDTKPIDVTSGTTIKNIVGIIDYSFRAYTLLIDPSVKPTVENIRKFVPASAAGEREITVASFNLENFFDDEENSDLGRRKEQKVSSAQFEKRLKKASLAIRNVVSMPDVLGIVEVENLTVLQKLAKRLNEDAVAAEQPNPKYEAVLEESNDLRGIDVGFLVKTSKIKVLKSDLLGRELKHDHPNAHAKETLFSRPPFLGEFELVDESEDFKFTVIVNHFKSFRGVESSRVQNKKRAQAEFLARFVSERQGENAQERIVLIGDFNAFQFPDGFNDVIGTLKGKPNKNVLAPAEAVYETGLINLVDHIKENNRYSYIFGGSAQTLDHILINKATRANAAKFGYARLNADFPKVYSNDETRPERLSDHDVPILYLSLGEKKAAVVTKPSKEVEENKTKPDLPLSLNAFLFHSFDKKGAELPDSELTVDNWIKFKTSELGKNKADGNLFEHKGEGPNGAEWNSEGDLFLVIESATSETGLPKIIFNGELITDLTVVKKVSADEKQTFFWAKIPAEYWKAKLKEILNEDVDNIFGEEMVKKVGNGEIETVAPLNTGKIIKFEIKMGDKTFAKYFHTAFGE